MRGGSGGVRSGEDGGVMSGEGSGVKSGEGGGVRRGVVHGLAVEAATNTDAAKAPCPVSYLVMAARWTTMAPRCLQRSSGGKLRMHSLLAPASRGNMTTPPKKAQGHKLTEWWFTTCIPARVSHVVPIE